MPLDCPFPRPAQWGKIVPYISLFLLPSTSSVGQTHVTHTFIAFLYDTVLLGMMIAAIMYATIPEPPRQQNTTHNNRITTGSILKYSPMPPQTPHNTLLLSDFVSLFVSIFYFLLISAVIRSVTVNICTLL